MRTAEVTILSEDGLHARPASLFVREAGKFRSEITVTADGISVNGKSIMGLLTLALCSGAVVTIAADGIDEENAVQQLAVILAGGRS